jgi:hypothetical protein
MRLAMAFVLAATVGLAAAQEPPKPSSLPYRIKIRHADPWAVKAMMEGTSIVSPEMSTVLGFMGLPQNATQAVGSLIEGGKLVVNPTDNSLWFFPDKK